MKTIGAICNHSTVAQRSHRNPITAKTSQKDKSTFVVKIEFGECLGTNNISEYNNASTQIFMLTISFYVFM